MCLRVRHSYGHSQLVNGKVERVLTAHELNCLNVRNGPQYARKGGCDEISDDVDEAFLDPGRLSARIQKA